MAFSGRPSLRTVSYPLAVNGVYTAIVAVTDANGTAHVADGFAMFAPTNYQWEAEDYNGGHISTTRRSVLTTIPALSRNR